MSKRISAVIPILVLASLLLSINSVYAPWSTLGTGYAITSNVHGIDVLPLIPVTITAGSLDTNVVKVTFIWHEPPDGNGPIAREVTVNVFMNTSTGQWNNGTTAFIRYAIDTYMPDGIGDWGVQALFQGPTGKNRAGLTDVIKIRATSFNVIPEVPFGTLMIIMSMFGALGVFALKKKRTIGLQRKL